MKQMLIAMTMIGLTCGLTARADDADSLVWCGLDYSKVKMIGTMDFREPDQIFPAMLDAWNNLYMQEMIPLMEKERVAPTIKSDVKAVTERNAKASANQVQHEDGTSDEMVKPSHITDADVAKIVASYDLKESSGTGLVFIMDRLVKAQQMECYYIVFFDIGSRKVLHSERIVAKAGGIGFRNFWFRPVKDGVARLPKIYNLAKGK
jgi:hypothetical protein